MEALTGYFDDSGDPTDGSQQFYAVAGYVAPASSWAKFDSAWQTVLNDPQFSVPYVHMRELHHRRGAFAAWKSNDDPVSDRTTSLLKHLTDVVRRFELRGYGAAIYKKDLQRFNREKGRSLNARALALYACLLELREDDRTMDVEIVLDRMNDSNAAIALAKTYAVSDPYYSFRDNEFPTIRSLRRDDVESAKVVPGLQLADFLVWELRKQQELRIDWYERYKPRATDRNWAMSLMQWFVEDRIKHMKRRGLSCIKIPENFQRRSLTELATAAPVRAGLWDYDFICAADRTRGGVWETQTL